MLGSLLALLPLVGLVAATPTPRQNGLQTINNCEVSGQIALTFDGESGRGAFCWARTAHTAPTNRIARTARTADSPATLDGPYIYETDVANALNGGLGTFFLNVSGGATRSSKALPIDEATVVESFTSFLTSLHAPPHLPSELPSQPCTFSATFPTTFSTTLSTTCSTLVSTTFST